MASKSFQEYHLVWLKAHPERDEAWLEARLKDGFDIHHIDGRHGNNVAGNLVLLEHRDHMRLHGMGGAGRLDFTPPRRVKRAPDRETLIAGKRTYERYSQSHDTWAAVGHDAYRCAKLYAESTGAKWPIKRKSKAPKERNFGKLWVAYMLRKHAGFKWKIVGRMVQYDSSWPENVSIQVREYAMRARQPWPIFVPKGLLTWDGK